jgi:rhodanese-related sulfurtransferase
MTETTQETVDTERARLMLAEAEVQTIDIRSADEFAAYRLPGSTNEPEANADTLAEGLGDENPVLIVCADGTHSAEVAGELRDRGLPAISLEGGTEAWRSDRLPTQPSPDVEDEGREPPKLPGAGV